jgi:nucleoside-diphosphate-sugar epimerase
MTTTARHVIFGTGAIGLATLEALRRRGETVRLVNRSGRARVSDDFEVVGDLRSRSTDDIRSHVKASLTLHLTIYGM